MFKRSDKTIKKDLLFRIYKVQIIFPALLLLFYSCSDHTQQIADQQKTIDSLQQEIDHAYTPGLGEFMLSFQTHHAKLWFAGIDQNWGLAQFEIGELYETAGDMQQYEQAREEIKFLPMLFPVFDSVQASIKRKDVASFKNNFVLLTNTCNACHEKVNYGFNRIKIPDTPPVPNQDFEVK